MPQQDSHQPDEPADRANLAEQPADVSRQSAQGKAAESGTADEFLNDTSSGEAAPPAEAPSSQTGWGCVQWWWLPLIAAAAVGRSQNDRNLPSHRDLLRPNQRPWQDQQSGLRHLPGLPGASPFPVSPLTSPHQERGRRSEACWRKTVTTLHRYRFELPQPSDEPADDYYRRHYEDFRAAVRRARESPREGVDSELIAMVDRHQVLDLTELELFESIQKLAARLNPQGLSMPLSENLAQAEYVLSRLLTMTDEEFGQLPAEVQQVLIEMVELEEDRHEQLREIEIMQARLNERYGLQFPLQELAVDAATDASPPARPPSPDVNW